MNPHLNQKNERFLNYMFKKVISNIIIISLSKVIDDAMLTQVKKVHGLTSHVRKYYSTMSTHSHFSRLPQPGASIDYSASSSFPPGFYHVRAALAWSIRLPSRRLQHARLLVRRPASRVKSHSGKSHRSNNRLCVSLHGERVSVTS